ncbi:hypothetical protein MAPG_07271 [Magnaporthiopsis poae ATCC 64411]|uniref:Chitin-binding type-4 domain-containing protein n=1 Tax=Magnaporthiopsis poae (strain ATCC 64411 / 73-15) TaxID=644358 RepID=A0A0C4E482_MAGP6|nr:hypothetical protein MAPG_07271 [Magnaporthiopsis poae ATCC 64411]
MLFITTLLCLVAQASAHGLVTSPATRQPGAATEVACGKKMVNFYKADGTSYPEAFQRTAGWNTGGYNATTCNMWLCKGYQFGDNKAQVQKYAPGTVFPVAVKIRIPHKGYANVSVVDTTTNKIIGEPLRVWREGYADPAKFPNMLGDQVNFNVTVPDLGSKCTVAGVCVVQWHWFGQGQTYQSCIDFTQTP